MEQSVRKRLIEKDIIEESTTSELLAKAFQPEAKWNNKDEFLDVVYWLRQVIGLVLGIAWGILPLNGIVGIILYFGINALVVYIYFNSYQKVDEDEYGGVTEILKEGLMTSFATFLVAWIMLYSAIHYD